MACRARVCASRGSLSPARLNLGDCEIGTRKRASALLRNASDLPALLHVSMASKVLATATPRIVLPPRSSRPLELSFTPRRINPGYRKEVTIVNALNPHDSHLLEVLN